jgi:hypothetical protein
VMTTEVYVLVVHGEEDDGDIIGVFDSPEAAYEAMGVERVYGQCLFLPFLYEDLVGISAAWPTVEESPFHGSRMFIYVWDPINEQHRSLLLMRFDVKTASSTFLQ